MAFELFYLKHALRIHNQMHRSSRVDIESTFGLEAFSTEFNEFLSSGFQLYHDAYYLQKGSNRKRIHEHKSQREHSRSILALSKLVSKRMKDGTSTEDFLLREKRMKKHPSLNEGFAHYTHETLLEAYDCLRILESKLLYAEHQVKQSRFRLFNRVPQYVIRQYSQYIKNQLKIINAEYCKLTRAMLVRLTLSSQEPSLQHGDVLYHCDPDGLVEDKLTQSSFQDFYNVINVCGDSATKKQLAQLPWATIVGEILVNHSLCGFSSAYNLARLNIVVRHLRDLRNQRVSEDQPEEELKSLLTMVNSAQNLAQEEKNNFDERKEFFNKWWRRLFNRKNLDSIHNIQRCLQTEATYIQRCKAIIQHKLDIMTERPERQINEIEEIQTTRETLPKDIEKKSSLVFSNPKMRLKLT